MSLYPTIMKSSLHLYQSRVMSLFNLLVYFVYQLLSWLLGEPESEWFPLIEEDVKVALRHGQWAAAEWLLQHGRFAIELLGGEYASVLGSDAVLEAVREDDVMALHYLLSVVDVRGCDCWYKIGLPGGDTQAVYTTALHEACRDAGVGFVDALLDAGMDLQRRDGAGLTPLDWAISGGYRDSQTIARLADPSVFQEAAQRRKWMKLLVLRMVSQSTCALWPCVHRTYTMIRSDLPITG